MNGANEHEFDPDFSELNPIQAEVAEIKENVERMSKKSFWASLLDKLTTQIIIQTD